MSSPRAKKEVKSAVSDLSINSTRNIISRLSRSELMSPMQYSRIRFSENVSVKWMDETNKYPAEQDGLFEIVQDEKLVARRKNKAEKKS